MRNTKEHITETALGLFLNHGYKSTSMAQLVEATGMSKGAFYHHFKNKEEIYNSVIHTYLLKYIEDINWQEFDNYSLEDSGKAMAAFYENFIKQIGQLTDKGASKYFSLFFEAYHQVPDFKSQIRAFYTRLAQLLQNKIMAEQSVDEKKAYKEAVNMIAHFEGLLFWAAVFPEQETKLSF